MSTTFPQTSLHKATKQTTKVRRSCVTQCNEALGLRVRVKKKGVRGDPVCDHRWMTYPSKNGLFLSPMYQSKLCWKILRVYPKKFSRIAFSLDLVVTVSQPALDS